MSLKAKKLKQINTTWHACWFENHTEAVVNKFFTHMNPHRNFYFYEPAD